MRKGFLVSLRLSFQLGWLVHEPLPFPHRIFEAFCARAFPSFPWAAFSCLRAGLADAVPFWLLDLRTLLPSGPTPRLLYLQGSGRRA